MPELKKLKTRLENLPERRKQRDWAVNFRTYREKLSGVRKKIEQIYNDMAYAEKVNSNNEYREKVFFELKKAVRGAQKLHKEISEEPKKVMLTATEDVIIKLRDYVEKARYQCDNIWNREIEGIVAKWEKMAEVVQRLGHKGGHEFKQVVDRLRKRLIPQNDKEVDQIKDNIKELQKGIAELGLAGPFGKFIGAAAGEGASLKVLLEDDEIRKKLEEHDLWDNFRIRFIG